MSQVKFRVKGCRYVGFSLFSVLQFNIKKWKIVSCLFEDSTLPKKCFCTSIKSPTILCRSHYGSISGMLRNDISLMNSIILHVKGISLKDFKSWVNDHFLNDVSSLIYTTRMLCEECNIDIVYLNMFFVVYKGK